MWLYNYIIPSHYVVFQKDSNRYGGAVLILFCSSIPAMERSDLETNCELLCQYPP